MSTTASSQWGKSPWSSVFLKSGLPELLELNLIRIREWGTRKGRTLAIRHPATSPGSQLALPTPCKIRSLPYNEFLTWIWLLPVSIGSKAQSWTEPHPSGRVCHASSSPWSGSPLPLLVQLLMLILLLVSPGLSLIWSSASVPCQLPVSPWDECWSWGFWRAED